jgi:transcriptional regulator with XRE-family HTH domain
MNLDPKVAEIGSRIRDRRLALGMTLVKLSKRCGVTPNYLGTVERGRRDAGLEIVRKIADGLGTTIADLLGECPTLSPAGTEVAHLLEGATPEVQDAIGRLLSAIWRKAR